MKDKEVIGTGLTLLLGGALTACGGKGDNSIINPPVDVYGPESFYDETAMETSSYWKEEEGETDALGESEAEDIITEPITGFSHEMQVLVYGPAPGYEDSGLIEEDHLPNLMGHYIINGNMEGFAATIYNFDPYVAKQKVRLFIYVKKDGKLVGPVGVKNVENGFYFAGQDFPEKVYIRLEYEGLNGEKIRTKRMRIKLFDDKCAVETIDASRFDVFTEGFEDITQAVWKCNEMSE